MKPYTWVKFSGFERLKQADMHGGDVIGEVTYPTKWSKGYSWWARTDNGRVQGIAKSAYAAQRAVRKALQGVDE